MASGLVPAARFRFAGTYPLSPMAARGAMSRSVFVEGGWRRAARRLSRRRFSRTDHGSPMHLIWHGFCRRDPPQRAAERLIVLPPFGAGRRDMGRHDGWNRTFWIRCADVLIV